MDFVPGNGTKMLSHKLALIEIKFESSSTIQCNQEVGHYHLTNPSFISGLKHTEFLEPTYTASKNSKENNRSLNTH